MRKLKGIKEESLKAEAKLKEATDKLEEVKRLEALAKEEELARVQSIKDKINILCSEEEMFCGVILSKEDVLAIVQMAIDTKDNIKIPYTLYFND